MRRLLNTLFILTEDAYLALENENVVVKQGEKVLGRVPLLTLESIIDFSWPCLVRCLRKSCDRIFLLDSKWEIPRTRQRREPRECPVETAAISRS